ncbi:MAG TPA: hypothetical protein EYO37_03855 [Nitrospina sp.]|nr:hypothetical protein [Nitrospina sp.]
MVYSKIIKRTTSRLIFPLLFYSRSYLLSKPFYSGLGSILTFHRICPEDSKPRIRGNAGLEVTPEYLENSIQFLRHNNYKIVSMTEAAQILKKGNSHEKFAVFTFDDGYVDNYLYAYPIFKKYGVPFTIYVTTQLPDGEAILWWYLLEDLILNVERIEFELNGRRYNYTCKNLWGKEWVYQDIHRLIISGSPENLNRRVQQVFKNFDNINFMEKTSELALNWHQIREMSEDPLVEIGAHTISHPPLNKVSESSVLEEMQGSRDKIELKTSQQVKHFSYPFGTSREVGQREFRIAEKCGFETSTTSSIGNIFPEHKNLLDQLPRIPVNQKRDNGEINYLKLWLNGILPCVFNKLKRVV